MNTSMLASERKLWEELCGKASGRKWYRVLLKWTTIIHTDATGDHHIDPHKLLVTMVTITLTPHRLLVTMVTITLTPQRLLVTMVTITLTPHRQLVTMATITLTPHRLPVTMVTITLTQPHTEATGNLVAKNGNDNGCVVIAICIWFSCSHSELFN